MVDMVITRILLSSRKSRSASNSVKWSDFGHGDSTRRGSRPEKTNPSPGEDFSISPSGFFYDMQSTSSGFLNSLEIVSFLEVQAKTYH